MLQNCQKETMNSENPLKDDNRPYRMNEDSLAELRDESNESQSITRKSEKYLIYPKWLHLSSSYWTKSSFVCADRRNIPYSTERHCPIDPDDEKYRDIIKNTKTNWRHRWPLLCFGKDPRAHGDLEQWTWRVTASEKIPRQESIVFWKSLNQQDYEWNLLKRKNHEDHVASKGHNSIGHNSILHYNFVHKFIPVPQTRKIPDAQTAMDKEWKQKLETIPVLTVGQSQKKRSHSWSLKKNKKKIHSASYMNISSEKRAVRTKTSQTQRTCRTLWWQCQRWHRRSCSFHWTKHVCVTNDCCQNHGFDW